MHLLFIRFILFILSSSPVDEQTRGQAAPPGLGRGRGTTLTRLLKSFELSCDVSGTDAERGKAAAGVGGGPVGSNGVVA